MTSEPRCPSCSALVRPGAAWCSLCHADLRPHDERAAEDPQPAEDPQDPPRTRSPPRTCSPPRTRRPPTAPRLRRTKPRYGGAVTRDRAQRPPTPPRWTLRPLPAPPGTPTGWRSPSGPDGRGCSARAGRRRRRRDAAPACSRRPPARRGRRPALGPQPAHRRHRRGDGWAHGDWPRPDVRPRLGPALTTRRPSLGSRIG